MKKWLLTPLAGFAILFAASVLQATPLLPGGNVRPSAESALPAGSFVFAPETLAITGINALGQTRFTGPTIRIRAISERGTREAQAAKSLLAGGEAACGGGRTWQTRKSFDPREQLDHTACPEAPAAPSYCR